MPPGSRYGKHPATREKVFIDFYAKIQEKSQSRETLAQYATSYLVVTPIVFILGVPLGLTFLWTGEGFAISNSVNFIGMLLILVVTTLLIFNIVLILRGRVKPSEKTIAKKIFTPENFKTCDATALRNYTLVSPIARQAIKKNLAITEEHIHYMQYLVADGYTGSFYDLCETVKKL